MKYLAILKDSLLEALDTKVFYVMMGLSFLVVAVVGSVSYRPVTVEDEVDRLAGYLNWVMGLAMRGKGNAEPPRIDVVDFHETNPQGLPSERDYTFTLVLHAPAAEKDKGDKDNQQRVMAQRMLKQALREKFPYLKDLEVAVADAPDPADVRCVVTTHGTKVTRAVDWPHEPVVFFVLPITIWHAPVGEFVHFWQDTIVAGFGAGIALLISTVITAFFIPNMLRKGTIDLLVVKPIHRTTLLLYKYVGGLAFMFLNTVFVVAGIWLILGLRSGMWGPGFLASIAVLTFQFAFYYAISTFVGVVTRSSIAAILVTCFAWFVFSFALGNGYRLIDATRKMPGGDGSVQIQVGDAEHTRPKPFPEWVYTTADVVHFVTPRLKDLDALTTKAIADDTMPEFSEDRKVADRLFADVRWVEAIGVTAIYIVVLLALSCWWFATKDY
jgi:ABC-type transport system involved in multi-copper enzyme maturation permease subunit